MWLFSIMASNIIFTHAFGAYKRVSFTYRQGREMLTLRAKYPMPVHIRLTVMDTYDLIQLLDDVSQALTDKEQRFFDINGKITVSVDDGWIGFSLSRIPSCINDKTFTEGLNLQPYDFKMLSTQKN